MRDEDLRFLGRAHSVAEAVAAVRRARAAGFDNLGIDLIVGLPGHTAGLTREILTEGGRGLRAGASFLLPTDLRAGHGAA